MTPNPDPDTNPDPTPNQVRLLSDRGVPFGAFKALQMAMTCEARL